MRESLAEEGGRGEETWGQQMYTSPRGSISTEASDTHHNHLCHHHDVRTERREDDLELMLLLGEDRGLAKLKTSSESLKSLCHQSVG